MILASKNAFAALGVDVLERVARHRGDDLDFVFGEELGETVVTQLEQDREVAALQDAAALPQCAEAQNEMAEIGKHFRGAP